MERNVAGFGTNCDGVGVLVLPPGLFVGQRQYWTVERVTGVTTVYTNMPNCLKYHATVRVVGMTVSKMKYYW